MKWPAGVSYFLLFSGSNTMAQEAHNARIFIKMLFKRFLER